MPTFTLTIACAIHTANDYSTIASTALFLIDATGKATGKANSFFLLSERKAMIEDFIKAGVSTDRLMLGTG